MKYAKWVLNFSDAENGTGPEDAIAKQGGTAEGAFAKGEVTSGAEILGYFTGNPNDLEAWSFTELTQEQALEFVQSIDNQAYVAQDGKINIPEHEESNANN